MAGQGWEPYGHMLDQSSRVAVKGWEHYGHMLDQSSHVAVKGWDPCEVCKAVVGYLE